MRNVEFIGDFNGDGHDDFAVVLLRNDDRTNDLSEEFIVGENCTPRLNDQGAFTFFSEARTTSTLNQTSCIGAPMLDVPEAITGGFDFNGDQLADLALGIYRRDPNDLSNAGAVTLITGRPRLRTGQGQSDLRRFI